VVEWDGEVVLVGESDEGGHFRAWEGPEGIVQDLKSSLGREEELMGLWREKMGIEE
jgi:hypothetical protein